MIPELAPVWRRWEETHAALVDCLEQFPDDRFFWKPAPEATSPSEIVTHVARAEIHYAARISREPESPPSIGYAAAEPGQAEIAVTDRASALRIAGAAAAYAVRAVERLSADELDRVVAREWRPLGPSVAGPLTVLWFVEQMNRHKAYHLGQLWYVTMLLSPTAGGGG